MLVSKGQIPHFPAHLSVIVPPISRFGIVGTVECQIVQIHNQHIGKLAPEQYHLPLVKRVGPRVAHVLDARLARLLLLPGPAASAVNMSCRH